MSVAQQLALRYRKGMVRGCPCNQDVSCAAAGPQIQEGYGEGDVPVIRMSVAWLRCRKGMVRGMSL